MAREYGKVLMSAWNDRDFCALPRRAQGTYWFLTSQSDLNRAGVITMALNRWASRCEENDRNVILNDLATLARERFIVVDEAEEEVLVRSFIRNDDGWKSPNIMVAVAAAARQISSETLRAVICQELGKIDTSGLPLKVSDKTGRSTKEFVEMVIADARTALADCVTDDDVLNWGTLSGTLPETLTRTLPDSAENGTLPGTLSERVPRGFPTTTTPETEPETTTETETSPSASASKSDEDFETFWDIYAKKVGRKQSIARWKSALKKPGVDAGVLIHAASEYVDYQTAEGKHPDFSKDPATWLNGEHWNDERASRRPHAPRPANKAEERMRANLSVVEQLRAEEQQQATHLRAIEGNR